MKIDFGLNMIFLLDFLIRVYFERA